MSVYHSRSRVSIYYKVVTAVVCVRVRVRVCVLLGARWKGWWVVQEILLWRIHIHIYLYICIYARSWIVRYGDGEVWRGVGGGRAGWSIVYSVSTRVPAV